jgi:uncharacterized membrane protein
MRRSMLPIPCAYLVAAIVLGIVCTALDRHIGTRLPPGLGVDGARDVLTSAATGMIAFTGLVVSSVLLAVQFAAGQYSPRLVLWFRQDQLVKHAIGSFLAAPVFALVALQEIESRVHKNNPDITVLVAFVLLVGAAVLFLALLQRVLDRLRPRSLYGAVAREGIRAARAVYPRLLADADGDADADPTAADANGAWCTADPRPLALSRGAGVVTSFDTVVLIAVAAHADVTLELAPAVGEFVAHRQPLLRVHGNGGRLDEDLVCRAVAVSEERTIEQDPAFAIRIIVDTSIRALSPAVNDPTTGAQAIDVLEVLVRELASRNLGSSLALDAQGVPRLVWRAPGWDDLLDLAFDEIREYGASSVQILRRLRAALEDLRADTPAVRHAAIDRHLEWLDETARGAHPAGSPEQEIAVRADRIGLGMARSR